MSQPGGIVGRMGIVLVQLLLGAVIFHVCASSRIREGVLHADGLEEIIAVGAGISVNGWITAHQELQLLRSFLSLDAHQGSLVQTPLPFLVLSLGDRRTIFLLGFPSPLEVGGRLPLR